ncbi:alpha/beta hydrolase [Companilactobacillus metriopterae]|uniref:alpha/beta hydrolase n=1 Tax=Companilactobacillus metriopterae TaxID=1909267 RepID=UPI00100ACE3F|nr:alpha/beta hydrolase [Companilactobacillus metriopterae]
MLNIFVGGSGSDRNFIVNDYSNGPSVAQHWGVNPSMFNIIEVEKNGTASFYKRVPGSKYATVVFKTNNYLVGELENLPYYLQNAVTLFRNAEGATDKLNIMGHSNGGNAVVRWLETYSPSYVNNIITIATPYNGKAVTVQQTGFVKEVIADKAKIKYSGTVNTFVAKDPTNDAFPTNIASDGVIAEDSALCASLVFPQSVTECNNQNHGTVLWSPEVKNVILKWF